MRNLTQSFTNKKFLKGRFKKFMEKKMTKKEKFAQVKEMLEALDFDNKDEILEFIDNEVALIEKKQGKKTLTKTQKDNEILKNLIVDNLSKLSSPIRIKDLLVLEDFQEYSTQKLTALCSLLVKESRIKKSTDEKGNTVFSIA